ncbi:Trigger factor [subsurface metagenome]
MVKNSHIVLLGILLSGAIFVSGCNAERDIAQAENGNIVQVHYTGTLEDGTVFDTSVGREPLQFTLGAGQMISGFEQAVLGMKIGESKTVTIPAKDAYGPRRDDLILVVPREELPGELTPEVGQQLQMTRGDGGISIVPIIDVSETTITIDANHHLAGKDLVFEIELVGIQ